MNEFLFEFLKQWNFLNVWVHHQLETNDSKTKPVLLKVVTQFLPI